MSHKILVGLDGTVGSWHALECALAYATGIGARVVGLFVESPLWTPPDIGRGAFESVVRTKAEHLAQTYRVPVDFRVRHGYPAHTIAEQARILGCDLVVLGHCDDNVLRHWLTGSVSQLVRHEAPCRVVVARSGQVLDLDQKPPAAVTTQADVAPVP